MFGAEKSKSHALPEEMRIAIEDHAQPLKMMLFVRHAWSLAQDQEFPALKPEPDPGSSHRPGSPGQDVWEQRWKDLWNRVWTWYERREQQTSPLSQEEMTKLSRPGHDLHPHVPPFWATEYGTEGLDMAAFIEWDRITTDTTPPSRDQVRDAALYEAWKNGLRTIIVLPFDGYLADRRSTKQLVISTETRKDTGLFVRALSQQD